MWFSTQQFQGQWLVIETNGACYTDIEHTNGKLHEAPHPWSASPRRLGTKIMYFTGMWLRGNCLFFIYWGITNNQFWKRFSLWFCQPTLTVFTNHYGSGLLSVLWVSDKHRVTLLIAPLSPEAYTTNISVLYTHLIPWWCSNMSRLGDRGSDTVNQGLFISDNTDGAT